VSQPRVKPGFAVLTLRRPSLNPSRGLARYPR
jgi:hypothetical protein